MDGNNRWAKSHHKMRLAGHAAGAEALRRVIRRACECGVEVLSVFAFSSENWKRPKREVDGLMRLFEKSLRDEVPSLVDNGIAIRIVGDRHAFSESLQAQMQSAEVATAQGTRLLLNVMANYGGRWEIADTARRLAMAVQSGSMSADQINEQEFDRWHPLSDQVPVDLMIRTGGEQRISNFILWSAAYAELVFSEVLWPDFDAGAFDACLAQFAIRERRFGLTSEQVSQRSC